MISGQASDSDIQRFEEAAVSGSLNDNQYDSTHADFSQTKEIERRSKRLMKGSQTMSNFNKTAGLNFNSSKPVKVQPQPTNDITNNNVKSISPAVIENLPVEPKINRETNQSALRRSSNYSARVSQKSGVGNSTASRAGKNIIASTPKSKSSVALSSGRAIRTGAFQRIKE
mmetsp:Transcript_32711/g.28984  ORF Transcript_32711/g.28984 Transcript_32711/m.28984 type:complete len:171 (+) Transcript_32711:1108-1620(+)